MKKKEGGSLPASVSLGLPLLLIVLFAVPTLLILRGSSSPGERAAHQVCERLFDAVRRADREALLDLFHPKDRQKVDTLAPERPMAGVARTEPLAFRTEGDVAEVWYTVDRGDGMPPKRITVRLRMEDGRWYVTSFDQP